MQFGFYFDSVRCTGCKTCELACKDYNNLDTGLSYRHVYDYEGGTWKRNGDGTWYQDAFAYHVSLSCNHCADAICLIVCPTGAMHREDNGIVRVNSQVCIGCGYCTLACPYHAPSVSDITHTSVKCDGCFERLEQKKPPICVDACPMRALKFDDIATIRKTFGTVAEVAPLPAASHSLPNLAIRPSVYARQTNSTDGFIANPKEVN